MTISAEKWRKAITIDPQGPEIFHKNQVSKGGFQF